MDHSLLVGSEGMRGGVGRLCTSLWGVGEEDFSPFGGPHQGGRRVKGLMV